MPNPPNETRSLLLIGNPIEKIPSSNSHQRQQQASCPGLNLFDQIIAESS